MSTDEMRRPKRGQKPTIFLRGESAKTENSIASRRAARRRAKSSLLATGVSYPLHGKTFHPLIYE
jgi:hypothetical protein